MTLKDDLGYDFNQIIRDAGTLSIISYYNTSGAGYDDDVTITKTGSVSVSGIFMPLDKKNSYDHFLLEQGRVLQNDSKFYINGSVTTGSLLSVFVNGHNYALIPNGVSAYSVEGVNIYKVLYLRNTGSFISS